jgi:hypothetical protein
MRAREPLFAAVYQDRSDAENAVQASATSPLIGPHDVVLKYLSIRKLRQQSSCTITVTSQISA